MSNDIKFGDMRTEYGKSLVELGEQDNNIVVLGADTTDSLKTADFGIKLPVVEKAITPPVSRFEEAFKPYTSASPPLGLLDKLPPLTINWNPPISTLELYNT